MYIIFERKKTPTFSLLKYMYNFQKLLSCSLKNSEIKTSGKKMKIKTSGNLAYQIRPSLTEDTRIQRFVKSTMLYFILYKHIEFVDRFNTPVT